jgi:hypothetical protein
MLPCLKQQIVEENEDEIVAGKSLCWIVFIMSVCYLDHLCILTQANFQLVKLG